jgi:flagellar protein FliT
MAANNTGAPDALARYRALERHCEEILDAARRDDWRVVEQLGRRSEALIERLRETAGEPMDDAARREKFGLLRSIVRIDAQIRHLAQPWTRVVDRMLVAGTPDTRERRPRG